MKLYVHGGTKFQRHVADTASMYMCRRLKLTRFPSLEVLLKICKVQDGLNGLCYVADYGDVLYKPRDLIVEIDRNVDLYTFIRTVCHEFIHVKQYVLGEIREDLIRGTAQWKKSRVPVSTPYRKQPWEKEAFRLENKYALEVLTEVEISMNGELL